MKIALYICSIILASNKIDQDKLPNRCVDIESNIQSIESTQFLTGCHDKITDEYYDLLTQKSDLMDCQNKNGQSKKYLRRYKMYEDNKNKLFLHNGHCPELNKFLEKHKYAQKSELTSTQVKLLLDVKREANELECEHKIHLVDEESTTK